ncbi:MAG: hypothetical protein ACOCQR_00525 [bacterium]
MLEIKKFRNFISLLVGAVLYMIVIIDSLVKQLPLDKTLIKGLMILAVSSASTWALVLIIQCLAQSNNKSDFKTNKKVISKTNSLPRQSKNQINKKEKVNVENELDSKRNSTEETTNEINFSPMDIPELEVEDET